MRCDKTVDWVNTSIIKQLGGYNTALNVLKQAQQHVLAPSVYVTSLNLLGSIYDDYDALFVYAGNGCFAYMPASEAMADNQVIWVSDLKMALSKWEKLSVSGVVV